MLSFGRCNGLAPDRALWAFDGRADKTELSVDECVNRCDADTACNAFTYNRLKQICFLKSAAAQWTIINLGAITGIRLSPFSLEGETPDQSPVPDEKKR